jgi:thioesterase domain-containing protein/acyl carrier protein
LRGDDARWEVDVFARKLGATADESWDLCATARATRTSDAPSPIRVEEIESRCTTSTVGSGSTAALRTRQEDHLRFGPRWRVLRRLSVGKGEALARLQLDDAYAGETSQFELHPALLDIATGCAMDLIPGYAAQEVAQNLWAPISYRGFRFHKPLTANLVSWLRVTPDSNVASGFAAFDVVLCDTQGNVLAEVDQLTLRRIDGELRIPDVKQDLPSAAEAASAPDKNRAKPSSPAEIALHHNATQGIDAHAGVQALARVLGAKTVPSTLIVSSMDLNALIRQAESISAAATATNETRFSRPQLDSEFEAPRDDVEKALAEIWGKLLGVEGIGIRDSFFDLGGHSLIAVRLFNQIADRFKVDLPMSVLMQSPTIARLADIVRAEAGVDLASAGADAAQASGAKAKQALQYRFVVPMHAGPVADRTPIFMVAGMFGNVLNLSHMAHLLGEERPFYALQARGLYGDSQPHESFEEAAADYIEEIRKVQPKGPYLLGGFSGGGITAYEMARQLLAQGEEVLQVIMLDTPLARVARFSRADRLSMLWQTFKRSKDPLSFVRERIKSRMEWHRKLAERENQRNDANEAAQFQSRRIGDAFMRAVEKYDTRPVPVNLALFRPKLDVRYHLSGGRRVDSERNYVSEDNGWTQYVSQIQVYEVPGNHDSMVLEPNVRVLVSSLRRAINVVEKGTPFTREPGALKPNATVAAAAGR